MKMYFEKIGMTSLLGEKGEYTPITVLSLLKNHFVEEKENGSTFLVEMKRKINKPELGYLIKHGICSKLESVKCKSDLSKSEETEEKDEEDVLENVNENGIDESAQLNLNDSSVEEDKNTSDESKEESAEGAPFDVKIKGKVVYIKGKNLKDQMDLKFFQNVNFVDVSGQSKGKGFQGPMKRHNFKGLRATHGVSVSHRSHGSTGMRNDPGKVFKNKKMAGHMGDVRVTKQSLRIFKVDFENNLLLICGSVAGPRRSIVEVKKAVKK